MVVHHRTSQALTHAFQILAERVGVTADFSVASELVLKELPQKPAGEVTVQLIVCIDAVCGFLLNGLCPHDDPA